jgi:hypothetical protein
MAIPTTHIPSTLLHHADTRTRNPNGLAENALPVLMQPSVGALYSSFAA